MIYADLHAHPFLCAFENRIGNNIIMSRDPNEEFSVWHQFPEEHNIIHSLVAKGGVTTYSESDFTQTAISGVRLINVAVYPPERGFFELDDKTFLERIINWLGLENFAEVELGELISGFSEENVQYIKSANYNYFNETLGQINFFTQTKPYSPDPLKCTGSVYSNIKNAQYVLLQNGAQLTTTVTEQIIQVLISVEGGNAFWGNFNINGELWNGTNFQDHAELSDEKIQAYQVLDVPDYKNAVTRDLIENHPENLNPLIPTEVCNALIQNVKQLLSHSRIFSFTVAHHFYNGLCGHCNSLQPLTDHKLVDQNFGISSDITNLGYMVINMLLSKKVIVDVKHMSWKARQSYYRFRANNYPNIPIIASHAAVSGKKWMDNRAWSLMQNNPFYQVELNLYDDDINEIVRSHGLIGILMDQRVNGVKDSGDLNTLWKQFSYIAEIAAGGIRYNDQTVWDNICLGTDFDGVIHPVDEFPTYTSFNSNGNKSGKTFYNFLLTNIEAYMQHPPHNFLAMDLLEPEAILSKICYTNMTEFVKRNYK